MRKLYFIFVLLSVAAGLFAQATPVRMSKNNFPLNPFDGILVNPHKGFTVPVSGKWNFVPEWEYSYCGSLNNKAWDVVSHGSGYQRWDKLNPEEGVYDWTELDKLLDLCEAHGLGYALRVLPYSSSKGEKNNFTIEEDYDWTPKFVYENGAQKDYATYRGYTVAVPRWDDPVYLQAQKDFAKAMAEKYDGDPRIEYIDIRTFGNWGEWHVSGFSGTQMPSDSVEMDMLDYYASLFKKTWIVLPSSGRGEVYKHALSLGIAKRDDGLIATPDRERELIPAYEANLPTIGENHDGYATLLTYTDVIPGNYYKWTLERWKKAIMVAHLTYYVLDQDSDAGYLFYKDNKVHVDSMTKVIGYNFRILDAELLSVSDSQTTTNTLNLSVKNTGVAPCFFDAYMVAEFVDEAGEVLAPLGAPVFIPKGTFRDEMTKDFSFVHSVPTGQSDVASLPGVSVALSIYESEDAYYRGENPTVRFDNEGLQDNKKLLLKPCPHVFGAWDTTKVATSTEPGIRRHTCMLDSCGSFEEEMIPLMDGTNVPYVENDVVVVCGDGKSLCVKNAAGKDVLVYDVVGCMVKQIHAHTNHECLVLGRGGVYLITIGQAHFRVVIN